MNEKLNNTAGSGSGGSPCSADLVQEAWEQYHGPIIDECGEEYIPAMPPAFMRGFVDGYEQGKKCCAIVEVLSQLATDWQTRIIRRNGIAWSERDEGRGEMLRECLEQLREVIARSKPNDKAHPLPPTSGSTEGKNNERPKDQRNEN